MLHTYICGGNIADTLHANLLDKVTVTDQYGPEGWGKPVWEMMVAKPTDREAIHNTANTYLGRLVPVSRLVRLDELGISMLLGNGFDYPIFPAFREAAATVVTRDEEPGLLSASLERSVWRQLSGITVKRQADKSRLGGPLALNNDLPTGRLPHLGGRTGHGWQREDRGRGRSRIRPSRRHVPGHGPSSLRGRRRVCRCLGIGAGPQRESLCRASSNSSHLPTRRPASTSGPPSSNTSRLARAGRHTRRWRRTSQRTPWGKP